MKTHCACLSTAFFAASVATLPLSGEDISAAAREPLVAAAVKIATIDDSGGRVGSGLLIDPRGYLLTSFRAVGHPGEGPGLPGELIAKSNRYLVATSEEPGGAARFRWLAAVVRADVRLDLALLRVVSRIGGGPLGSVHFRFVSPSHPAPPAPEAGAPVFVVGYEHGSRVASIRPAPVRAVQKSAVGLPAWLRLGRRLDPEIAGAVIVNREGIPVAIGAPEGGLGDPVTAGKPLSRLPDEWLASLRNGDIEDVRITGVRRLPFGESLEDAATGIGQARDGRETHHYIVPPIRPLTVRTDPPLPLVLRDRSGRAVRRAQGELEVRNTDPSVLSLAVTLRADTRGPVPYTIAARAPGALDDEETAKKPSARGLDVIPGAGSAAFVLPGPREDVHAPRGSTISGLVRDALTGQPVHGAVVIAARPGVDVGAHLSAFLLGEVSERQFRAKVADYARTNVHGTFELSGLKRGQRYELAAFAPSYRPVTFSLHVQGNAPRITIDPIEMTR